MQRLWDRSPPSGCISTVSMRHGMINDVWCLLSGNNKVSPSNGMINDKARIFANPASAHQWGHLCKPPLPSFCGDSDAFVGSWWRRKSYSEAQGFHSWDVKDHIPEVWNSYAGGVKNNMLNMLMYIIHVNWGTTCWSVLAFDYMEGKGRLTASLSFLDGWKSNIMPHFQMFFFSKYVPPRHPFVFITSGSIVISITSGS